MNLNMADIPSKYIEDPCVTVSVDVGIFSERLTNSSRQDPSLRILAFLKLTDLKNIVRNNFSSPELASHFFFFNNLCH